MVVQIHSRSGVGPLNSRVFKWIPIIFGKRTSIYIHIDSVYVWKIKMNQINKAILLIWTKISPSYFSYLTNSIVCRGPWSPMERQSPPQYLTIKKIPKPYCSCTMTEPPYTPATKSWSHLAAPRAMRHQHFRWDIVAPRRSLVPKLDRLTVIALHLASLLRRMSSVVPGFNPP
jgi:hypothetical protein